MIKGNPQRHDLTAWPAGVSAAAPTDLISTVVLVS